jgi:hypothetical protein
MSSKRLHQLEQAYLLITKGVGSVAITEACNALVDAERLESHLHWGVFSGQETFQKQMRIKSWQRVQLRLNRIEKIITQDLAGLVSEMREIMMKNTISGNITSTSTTTEDDEVLRNRIGMFETDLVMKATLFDLLQPKMNNAELVVTTWTSCPFILERLLKIE